MSDPDAGIPPMPDIYTVFTFDNDLRLHWDVMTHAERRSSAVNTNRVVWDGPLTTGAAAGYLDNAPRLIIGGPRFVAGSYVVQTAEFGPPLDLAGASGSLAVVNDGSEEPTLGCNALVNGAEITDRIAVVDRGECNFTVKVKNAQNAGAVAVIVVNNRPQEFVRLGGEDPTITIPSAHISQADGERIKSAVESGRVRRGVRRASPAGARAP
jgi:hypothetical protein